MKIYKETIGVRSHGKTPSYIDITKEVKEAIAKSGVQDGICVVISPHTTCSVFFEEYCHDRTEDGDEFLQADLNDALNKIIPEHVSGDQYRYPGKEHFEDVRTWASAASYLPNDDISDLYNGDAHMRATLLGSSQTFDVSDGKLGVGETGYIYFTDFDRTRARDRKCKIVVLGEEN